MIIIPIRLTLCLQDTDVFDKGDTTDATATAHISLTPMTARALAIELLSKADGLDSPVVDVLDDEGSNMISGHSYQE